MLKLLDQFLATLFWLTLCSCFTTGLVYGEFTTFFNVPPDAAPSSIESDTQLNLFKGGMIDASFDAGASDGTSTNIEVNISGGTVGDSLKAHGGSVVNVSGGSVGDSFDVKEGSVLNVFGGSVGDDLFGFSGSVVNVSGGSVGDRFSGNDSLVNISGGLVGDQFSAFSGSEVNITGGSAGDGFRANSGTLLNISGGEFRVDGLLLDGLDTVGDTLSFDLPEASLLSGTLADGTPFAFSKSDSDLIADGTLTLEATALPPVGPGTMILPGDPVPQKLRSGQKLVVQSNGVVGDHFNAGWGATVHVAGGRVGDSFEAVGTQVTVSEGSVGDDFDAFNGSVVNLIEGSIGIFLDAFEGSQVNVSGGSVGDRFDAENGGVVNVSGGSVGDDFDAFSGSVVNLRGTEFVLDNIDITDSLTRNVPSQIDDRDVTISGRLADGSPFSFDLNSTNASGEDYFDPGAILTVTLFEGLLGDYNDNGVVDAADFEVWRDAMGQVLPQGTGADGNFDGVIDEADFYVWHNNFGNSTPAAETFGDFDDDLDVDGHDLLKWQRGESPNPLSTSDLAAWETNYGTAAEPLGDFDDDRDVDGHDLLKWQRGESPNPLSTSDLAAWETNYGTAAPPAAAKTMVPEPSTWILLLLGMMALHSHR